MTADPVDDAIADISNGKFVIIVDDEDRENEGDLCMAADRITPEAVNFMVTHARGLVCAPAAGWRLDELGLGAMIDDNTSPFGTAFTVSVDGVGRGVTTGVSAFDRATAIRLLCDEHAKPTDFAKPGHTFPLRAAAGGVLERAGHTEAIVDLCKLAGRFPVGVVCEIMNADGTVARRPELDAFAREHGIRIVAIDQLIARRLRSEQLVTRGATTRLPTPYGTFTIHGYEDVITKLVHIALVLGDVADGEPVLIRVHSECLTGDVFGSQRCDCQAQIHKALELIGREGRGVLVYLRQEGRGIGLIEKLRAYALQDQGLDTVEANERLGHPADKREYGTGSQIITDLGVSRIRILTNNPRKWYGLGGFGLEVTEQLPLLVQSNVHNERYLETKRDKMGHLFAPGTVGPSFKGADVARKAGQERTGLPPHAGDETG